MKRRVISVFMASRWAEVRGYGSRELFVELRGRAPVWVASSRSWSTTKRTARDLIALAQSRGYEVEVEYLEPVIRQAVPAAIPEPASAPVEFGGLW